MTGAQIRVDITGAEETLAALRRAAERTAEPRGLWDAIGLLLVGSTQQRFERGVGPSGSPWPPSARARFGGGKTLIDTARLMQSITFVASDAGVEVGTNVIYAAIHQFGGDIKHAARQHTTYRKYDARTDELSSQFVKRKHSNFAEDVTIPAHTVTMPARPFLGLDQDDERDIVQTAEDFLAEGLDERH